MANSHNLALHLAGHSRRSDPLQPHSSSGWAALTCHCPCLSQVGLPDRNQFTYLCSKIRTGHLSWTAAPLWLAQDGIAARLQWTTTGQFSPTGLPPTYLPTDAPPEDLTWLLSGPKNSHNSRATRGLLADARRATLRASLLRGAPRALARDAARMALVAGQLSGWQNRSAGRAARRRTNPRTAAPYSQQSGVELCNKSISEKAPCLLHANIFYQADTSNLLLRVAGLLFLPIPTLPTTGHTGRHKTVCLHHAYPASGLQPSSCAWREPQPGGQYRDSSCFAPSLQDHLRSASIAHRYVRMGRLTPPRLFRQFLALADCSGTWLPVRHFSLRTSRLRLAERFTQRAHSHRAGRGALSALAFSAPLDNV